MHIPPYHNQRCFQCIFIGIFIGSIISYVIFLFMYGLMYEELYENNLALKSEVTELKNQNEALLLSQKENDELTKQSLTIEKIEIFITNEKQLRLDRLIIHQLEEMIKEEINHIIGKDIVVISEADVLLQSAIENKAFTVDDFSYYFEIKKLTISPVVKITLQAKIA